MSGKRYDSSNGRRTEKKRETKNKMVGWHGRGYRYVSTRNTGSGKKPNWMERNGHDGHQRSFDDLTAQGGKMCVTLAKLYYVCKQHK